MKWARADSHLQALPGALRALCCALFLSAAPALAEPDGITEPIKPQAKDHPLTEIWSGYHYLDEETRRMQDDDKASPAMALYETGKSMWTKVAGKKKKSCDSCHGDAAKSMRSVGARFPVYYGLAKKPVNVEGRINLCREKFMEAKTLTPESEALLALTVYVKSQSRQMSVNPQIEGALAKFFDKGKTYYTTRRGQLDMSCSHCHDRNAGRKLRGEKLSQGQSNGFPAYRKSWKATGTLLRQVNACLTRLRANPLKFGSDDFVNLELYLAWRGQGLKVETPAVRE